MKKTEYLAEIAIQGDQVLSFINCTQERAIYEVIGFDEPRIVLIDYRPHGINAIHELLETKNLHNFAPVFNTPALITLQEGDDGAILIELNEANESQPDKMLWIAIGSRDSIPLYDYLFEQINPLEDDRFAFIALFEIPDEHQHQSAYSSEASYSK